MADVTPDFQSQFRGVGYPEVVALVKAAALLQPALVGFKDGHPRVFMLTERASEGTILGYRGPKGSKLDELLQRTRLDHPHLVVVRSDHPAYERERTRSLS